MLGSRRKSRLSSSTSSIGGAGAGIIVHVYQPPLVSEDAKCLKFNTPGKVYSAEGLCWHAAVKLNIKPITFHIFSLYCLENEQWLASNDDVKVKEDQCQEFEFRIRLKLSNFTISQLPSLDPATLNYLYLQCRHDFVNEKHVGKRRESSNEQWAKKCIGLGLIDAVCCLKYANLTPSVMSKYFKNADFLPPRCIRNFSDPINKIRLQSNFKDGVERKYQDWNDEADLTKLKLQYILGGIYDYYTGYLVEEFRTDDDELFTVDPLGEDAGLYNQTTHTLCTTIQGIIEIHIKIDTKIVVHINHSHGIPVQLKFSSPQVARSLVSLLEKYYRMMVEYHVHICKSLVSPLIMWMEKAKVHGPVRGSWAWEKLTDHNREHNEPNDAMACNYLLKQLNRNPAPENASLWNIELVLCKHSNQLYVEFDYNLDAPHMWYLPCSLSVDGKRKFQRFEELMSHYTQSASSELCLRRCLRPLQTKPVDERLLLCKPSKQDADNLNLFSPIPPTKYPQILPDVNVNEQSLFPGRYTNVLLGLFGGFDKNVAVKQLKAENFSMLDMFTRSAHKVAFWTDPNIVHVHGICMKGPFSLVEEYAPFGNLHVYLSQRHKLDPVKVLHLVLVARQLASALYYLSERGDAHGNVRCRNILVFSHDAKSMLVKLADPGMIYSYSHKTLEDPVNEDRIPWLAPELFDELASITPESDMYAFGVSLWEMFSMGSRPLVHSSSREIIRLAREGLILDQPELCPVPIFDLIKQCCQADPHNRLTSRVALRNINSVEMNADDQEYARPSWESTDECQEVLENRLNSAQIKRNNKQFLEQEMPVQTNCDIEQMNNQMNGFPLNSGFGGIQSRPLPAPPIYNDPLLIRETELHFEKNRLLENKLLGKGYYGQVYLAVYKKEGYDPRKVAVKSLNAEMYESCVQEFERELKIMAALQHDNIVAVIGKCPRKSDTEPMSIVMEYVEKGCLRDYLKQNRSSVNQSNLMRFSLDVAAGMCYLSSQQIIHNDLAARNVLVTADKRAKISDFGLARLLPSNRDYYKQQPGKAIPAFWCAPEAIHYQRLSQKSDVWSYGITLWEIYSLGKCPHLCEDAALILKLLNEGKRLPTKQLDCPQGVREVMSKCWKYEAESRPEFAQIYEELSILRNSVSRR